MMQVYEICDFCDRLECNFDSINSLLDQDPSLRNRFVALISRLADHQSLTTPAPTPPAITAMCTTSRSTCGTAPEPIPAGDGDHGAPAPEAQSRDRGSIIENGIDSLSLDLVGCPGVESSPSQEPSSPETTEPSSPSITSGSISPSREVQKRKAESDNDGNRPLPSKRGKGDRNKNGKAKRPAPSLAIEDIAGYKTIQRLRSSFRSFRVGLQSFEQGKTEVFPLEPGDQMDAAAILERLDALKRQFSFACSSIHFAKATGRFHHVQMVHLYHRVKIIEENTNHMTYYNSNDSAPRSLVDQFAEKLFPEKTASATERGRKSSGTGKRQPHKSAFNVWLTLGNKLVELVSRYGSGILFLLPDSLTDDNFRRISESDLEAAFEHLDLMSPNLKDCVQPLTDWLPSLAAWGVLPQCRLRLETYSESQIFSEDSIIVPLRELLTWCNEMSPALQDFTLPRNGQAITTVLQAAETSPTRGPPGPTDIILWTDGHPVSHQSCQPCSVPPIELCEGTLQNPYLLSDPSTVGSETEASNIYSMPLSVTESPAAIQVNIGSTISVTRHKSGDGGSHESSAGFLCQHSEFADHKPDESFCDDGLNTLGSTHVPLWQSFTPGLGNSNVVEWDAWVAADP